MKKSILSIPVIFLLLVLNNQNILGKEEKEPITRKEIAEQLKIENEKVDTLIGKNERSIIRTKLYIQELLEQGMQVIKPWEHSWQLGINYFHTYNHGGSRPDHERFFIRDNDIFNRNLHLSSVTYKKLPEGSYPAYVDTNLRKFLGTSYGFIETKFIDEPLLELNIFPSLKQKKITDIPLPEKQEIAYIKPQSPKIPEIIEVPSPKPLFVGSYFYATSSFNSPIEFRDNSAYIADGRRFYKRPSGDRVRRPVAMFSQQDMESTDPSKKGKFTIANDTKGLNVTSENITFSSIYKKNNEKEFPINRPFNFNLPFTGPRLYPLKFTGPHFFTIKNCDLVSETNKLGFNTMLFSNKDGDTSLTLDENSTFTVNGQRSSPTIYMRQFNPKFIPAFINKGKIQINNNKNSFTVVNKSAAAIENRGDVTVLGESNKYVAFYNSKGFSFVNKKNILLDKKGNTCILISANPNSFGEIILESPIEVKGTNNRGIVFLKGDNLNLYATDKSAPRGAISSNDPDIKNTAKVLIGDENGKYRNSLLNMKVSGKMSVGIVKDPKVNNLVIDNFNLVASNDNNTMIFLGKTTHSTIGKNLPGTILIADGVHHTGISILDTDFYYNSENKTHVPDFSTELVGDKAYIKVENSFTSQGFLTIGGEALFNGHIEVNSPASTGMAINLSWVKNTGTLDFNGWTKDGEGATGIVVRSSNFESNGEVNIKVSGKNSSGISVEVYPDSLPMSFGTFENLTVSFGTFENVTVSAEDNAVAIANTGDSVIYFNKNNTINVGKNAQGIYTKGPIHFNDKVVMNVIGDPITGERGLGMNLFLPPNIPDFATAFRTTIQEMTDQTFNNFEINLDGGIAFRLEEKKINLSETTPQGVAALGGPKINIMNDDSFTFAIKTGELTVDQDVNLDNPGDAFNQIMFADTPVINNSNVKGTKDNQYFAFILNNTQAPEDRFIKNHGTIDLSGKNAVALYSDKGNLLNDGKISVGENSIAMEILNDNNDNLGDSTVRELSIVNSATGDISVGKKGVGIYYTEDSADDTQHIKADIENAGKIHSNSSDVTGMFITIDNPPEKHPDGTENIEINTFKNTGTIELTENKSVGIFVKNNIGKLEVENTGEIIVGNSKSGNSSAAILNQNENSKITNSGKITSGNSAYGIIGYEIETTPDSEIKVGEHGVGIYSGGKDVNLKGKLEVAGEEAIGLYSSGNNQTITADLDQILISKGSVGFYTNGYRNNLEANCALPVDLKGDSAFMLSKFGSGDVTNKVNLTTSGDFNFGIYAGGNIKNEGNMDFTNGVGNIGAFAIADGTISNSAKIKVGESDRVNELYSVGMAGGYYDHENEIDVYNGVVINEPGGTIEVVGDHGIGMYASGRNSKAINYGNIKLMGKYTIGMFIENGAVGENYGTITATPNAVRAIGGLSMRDGFFKNYGTISIKAAEDTTGLVAVNNGKCENDDHGIVDAHTVIFNLKRVDIDKSVLNSSIIDKHDGKLPTITVNNVKQPIIGVNTDTQTPFPDSIDLSFDEKPLNSIELPDSPFENIDSNGVITKLGMYVDTSGVNFTNPITGIENIHELVDLDFIIGTEAARYTNSKAIEIQENIIEPYNEALLQGNNIKTLSVYGGSLTWISTGKLNDDGQTIKSLYLAKVPYTDFCKPIDNLYNFTDGLEKRYGVEDIYSREKQLFNKLNTIGENEQVLLSQSFREMMGYEYSNTYRRIWDGKRTFDREFDTLMKWDTNTKDTTKVKFFREDNKFRTRKDGVNSYNRTSEGVFVLNNNETVTLGDSWGWFFGASIDRYKFKDLGGSKERSYNGEIGYYKSKAFGHNEEVTCLIKGGVDASHRKMNRRYVVIDEVFRAKSRYHSLGGFIDTDFSTNFRLSQGFTLTPSVGVDLSATRVGRIKEKSGEVRLRVKGRTEVAATPHANLTLAHSTDRTKDSRIKTELSYGISRKYARDPKFKAKVNYTDADYYSLEKDKYKTNSEISLGIALEKPGYGVGAKVIRNLNHNHTSYQLDFRIKF